MEIKKINADELDLVASLFDKYRVFYKQPSDINLAQSFLYQRLSNHESVVFVALDDQDKPAGFTQLYPKYSSAKASKNWILNDLYVDEAYRKQGIGAKLIMAAINFSKETGAGFIQLDTAKDNYTAQSLYKSIGFVKQHLTGDFLTFKLAIA